MKTIIRTAKGKITDKWIKKYVPGYCVRVHYLLAFVGEKVEFTWLYGFDEQIEAYDFLRALDKGVVNAVLYNNGEPESET